MGLLHKSSVAFMTVVLLSTLPFPSQLFCTESVQHVNSFSGIKKLNKIQLDCFLENYKIKNKLNDRYGYYKGTTADFILFLEQFVDLEELDCRDFSYYSYNIECAEFIQHPPRLPKLKSVILSDHFSGCELNWLTTYPLLENLTIYIDENEIDLAPLQQMTHLLELKLRGWKTGKVIHADYLPASLQFLTIEDMILNPLELSALKLKYLTLNSKQITTLPPRQVLAELVFLDISECSIRDLDSLEGLKNLKVFKYAYPRGEGVKANFSVIHTLSNLEELCLGGFPQRQEKLCKALLGLSKLQSLTLSGEKLFDLSFLEGMSLTHLAMPGRLLSVTPISVLNNPTLTHVDTTDLQFVDETFTWSEFSPNIRRLDLGESDFCDFSDLARFPLDYFVCNDIDQIDHEEQLLAFAPTLESLMCQGSILETLIKTYDENIFKSFGKLKFLAINLYDCGRWTSLDFLKKFPTLEKVDIYGAYDLAPESLDVFLEMNHLKEVSIDGSYEIWKKEQELRKQGMP